MMLLRFSYSCLTYRSFLEIGCAAIWAILLSTKRFICIKRLGFMFIARLITVKILKIGTP